MGRSTSEGLPVVRLNMTVLIILIPLGVLIGLIARAARKTPGRYIDLLILTRERHKEENEE